MTPSERWRFWAKVPLGDGCWIWPGHTNQTGYGRFFLRGRLYTAHRVAYEDLVGPIPDGCVVDHVKARGCTSRACVNPGHLEPVTQAENCARAGLTAMAAANAAKTHCPQGHPYDEENTYLHNGHRACRRCHQEIMRARPIEQVREYDRIYKRAWRAKHGERVNAALRVRRAAKRREVQ